MNFIIAPFALHTAIWTGSEMIVWDGADNGGTLNTGGRYNPETNRWRTTSTPDAPLADQNTRQCGPAVR